MNYFDGSAVVGANVTCGPYKGNLSSIVSDASGNFLFPNVAPGFYECFASFQTSVSTLTTFSVFPGSNRFANKTEVITLDVETGILTGSTFYKAQNLALGGVKVVCRNQFNRRETFSDSSARFFFTGIRPGLYQCEGSAAGYSPVTSLVLVTQAAVTTVDVFVDVLRGNIAGTIVNSRTGLNVESTVTCSSNNETFTGNTTGGFFFFKSVYPTKAQCFAFPLGTGWIGNSAVGTVPPGLNLTLNINVTQVLSNLSGIVINSDTKTPIRFADVTCTAPGYLVIALTKPDGTFNFTNLAAASYSCEIRKGGYSSFTVREVALTTNAALILPAVGLSALPGSVTVLLSSTRTSLPIAGFINCSDPAGVIFSGSINGSADLGYVLPGTFTCSASSPTFVSTTSTRSVPPMVPVYFSLQLEPQYGSISGKVIDALVGIPVSGATIACANINPVLPAFYSATSDGAGRFTFPKVFLDSYACVVQTISYSNNAFNVTVGTQGQNVDASFNLQPIPAAIRGQVVENGTQNFLVGAAVNCTFYGGPAVYLVSNTSDRGTFAFDGLMSFGPWRCVISTPGYSHANGRDFDSIVTVRGTTTQIKILMQPAPGSAQITVVEAKTKPTFILPFAKVFCRPVGGDDSSSFRVFLNAGTGVGTFTAQRGNFFCTSKLEPGYVAASSNTFAIIPGGLTSVLIEMSPIPGTLELLVIDSTNALIKVAGGRVFCGNILVLTDPQGHATVPGLPRGVANCTITATGYADLTFTASIVNGLPTPLTVSLRKTKKR